MTSRLRAPPFRPKKRPRATAKSLFRAKRVFRATEKLFFSIKSKKKKDTTLPFLLKILPSRSIRKVTLKRFDIILS